MTQAFDKSHQIKWHLEQSEETPGTGETDAQPREVDIKA